jgi:adenine-specific DNA-methyltransferase
MDDKLDLKSLDIKDDKIEQLKKAFPEVVTEGKVDFERLKNELGEEVETGKERYEMKWPGKASLSKIIQEPSIGTLNPVKEASVDFDTSENLFIEGDSLEVLKLLQKSYYGKVKMIYIDPPYNTGKDFIYPDNYTENLETYLRYTGQKGEEGLKLTTNAETEGRYHSKWMNMMYPRLFLARNLLKEDGVIFISIDDHEVDNLKKISNEIFGEENFIAQLIWKNKKGGGNDATHIATEQEYVLIYSKDVSRLPEFFVDHDKAYLERYNQEDEYGKFFWDTFKRKSGKQYYPIKCPDGSILEVDENGNKISWLRSESRFKQDLLEGEIKFLKIPTGWSVQFKQREPEGKKPRSILMEHGTTSTGSSELLDIFSKDIFQNPKPTGLLRHLIEIADVKNDYVLDFFAGSATTAHAVLNINKEDGGNRKFIMVQLQEPTQEDSEAKKAGFNNIAEIGEERIRRVIKKIKEENAGKLEFENKKMDLGFKVFRLEESNFKIWDKKSDVPIQEQLQLSVSNINEASTDEDILYEIILKSGFELSVPVDKLEIHGKTIYSVDNKSLLICLDNDLTQEFINDVSGLEAQRVVFLDRGFSNNDQLKTNTVELMKANGVEFKTI